MEMFLLRNEFVKKFLLFLFYLLVMEAINTKKFNILIYKITVYSIQIHRYGFTSN